MKPVCRPGGRVVVADLLASPDPVKAEAHHRMEILRDPRSSSALLLGAENRAWSRRAVEIAATIQLEPALGGFRVLFRENRFERLR